MRPVKITLTFIIAFFLLIIFSGQLSAQHHYHETIYLKNGVVVKGFILEYMPDKSIKIKTTTGEIVTYKSEDVEKIEKHLYDAREKGYFNITELNFGAGSSNTTVFGISSINGFLLKRHFSVGLGVGIDNYTNLGTILPLFVDVRHTFHDRHFTPFICGQVGYSFALASSTLDNFQGGIMFNPSIGVQSHLGKKSALQLSFGVREQSLQYNEYDPITNGTTSINSFYTVYMLKAGVRF